MAATPVPSRAENTACPADTVTAAKASLERALAVNPKVNGANYMLSQISTDMKNTDDAIKYAKADAAADPGNKARAAQLILSAGVAAYKAGDASKAAEDYKKAIPILAASDSLAPTPAAKFYLAVAAFQAVYASRDALTASKSCDDFKAANDLLTLVNINMSAGASVDATTAKAIMGGAMQFQPFVDGNMKKFCK